jgi:hypothetical protein
MARGAAPLEAPVRVEQALGRAFREQRQAAIPAPATFALGWRGRLALAATAAAAAVAVTLWLSTNRATPRPEPTPQIVQDSTPEPGAASPAPDRLATLPAAETQRAPVQEEAPTRASRPAIAPKREQPAPAAVAADQPQEPTPTVAAAAAPQVREIKTDFLPLVYGDDLSSYQGAQLVRVRLPREALTYFGLPSHGLSGEHVPADVLLGEDGTARAVRFVRYARGGSETREIHVFEGSRGR